MHVFGDTAYVARGWSGLQLLDVSDPAEPAGIGFIDTPGQALGVRATEDYVFVADSRAGFQVIRLSGPVTNVNVLSTQTLTATLPAGLSPGLYHLVVRNPDGGRAVAHNIYRVE